ncbi:MAG: RtcB family protein [Bacteroidales bacterium]|jgi:tRNA-splicing ligase RtcB
MKKVITTARVPIKLWLDEIEEGAMRQAENVAALPFSYRHVALMPDAHEGFGMPIGGVLATDGVIVPNAVGVDIGCGMCAVKTSLETIEEKQLKQIMGGIRKLIPLGFKHHKQKQELSLMPVTSVVPEDSIVGQEFENAREQIGTLGGGNHFIEIQKGSDGHIWIMVHSGSRNLGKKVADHYNRLAKKLNEQWHTEVPRSADLAFLPVETPEAGKYLAEMGYCVDFAFANRKLMMNRIRSVFKDRFGQAFSELHFINIAHNYASREHHFGKDVFVHRKGATSAKAGEEGIIPGSQGTKSYIVEGRGNIESFHSCSHGAGRVMGRRQAQRTLDLKTELRKLDRLGIIHAIRHQRDLDEAPSAYKNIDEVMENQRDLVDIRVELNPLAVIKG